MMKVWISKIIKDGGIMNINKYLHNAVILGLLGFILTAGCSSTTFNPVKPNDLSDLTIPAESTPIVASSLDGSIGEGIWGIYQGHIDIVRAEASLTPLRGVSSGLPESVETDITSFLMAIPCPDCAQIVGVRIDSNNHPVLRIGIRHPFNPGDVDEPPTAMNRLDLHVFNVRGFIVSDGNTSPLEFPGGGFKTGGFELVNADGYSGEFSQYWDSVYATEANLHPYVLHFDDYSLGNFDPDNERGFTSLTEPEGNLVMPMGSDIDIKEYVFDLKNSESFKFIYTLSASYGISAARRIERLEPTYRLPLFNSKAASEVRVLAVDNSEFIANDETSSCKITLEVYDINHGVTVGEGLDEMPADSSVAGFTVEIPGVTAPVWETSSPEQYFKSGDGRFEPLIYELIVSNALGADTGIYNGLVGVIDGFEYDGSLEGNAIHYIPPGADPTHYFFTVDQWVTYTTFEVEVLQGCGPITGSITNPTGPSINILNNDTINFSGTGSSDNDGDPIVQYEWDWGDGSPKSYGQSVEHQFINPNCDNSEEPITYTVTLTLTDSCDPPNVTQVDSIDVIVECPDCINPFEDFDGGTIGDWVVEDWHVENTDNSGLFYGGWDEYKNHQGSTNCNMSMCRFQNCYFTSGDNIEEGHEPGFCNDYSGPGRYYLISPVIDLSEVTALQASISIWHFYHVLDGPVPDGCAVYISTNGGASFNTQLNVLRGDAYNSTFTEGTRTGDPCFTGITPGEYITETEFDLTPYIGQSEIVIRFEQHNNNSGAVGTPGFPVGWWIDDITLKICP